MKRFLRSQMRVQLVHQRPRSFLLELQVLRGSQYASRTGVVLDQVNIPDQVQPQLGLGRVGESVEELAAHAPGSRRVGVYPCSRLRCTVSPRSCPWSEA
jgi:hypothetical protein